MTCSHSGRHMIFCMFKLAVLFARTLSLIFITYFYAKNDLVGFLMKMAVDFNASKLKVTSELKESFYCCTFFITTYFTLILPNESSTTCESSRCYVKIARYVDGLPFSKTSPGDENEIVSRSSMSILKAFMFKVKSLLSSDYPYFIIFWKNFQNSQTKVLIFSKIFAKIEFWFLIGPLGLG